MMAFGVTLILLAVLRVMCDKPKIWPLLPKNAWKWGMCAIVGFAFVVASLIKFLWDKMP